MEDQRHDQEVREFRLEGVGLYVIGALFLAALACAFYVGRWVERRTAGPNAGSVLTDGGAAEPTRTEPPVDVTGEATYFDTVSGGEKEPEPGRQAIELPSTSPPVAEGSVGLQARPPERSPLADEPSPAAGPFYVQLFAGRDKGSAEGLVRGLNERGYRVRLDTERAGDGLLYRVRVGGYAAKPDAEVLADRLRGEGHSDAWVTRVD